MYLVHPSSRGMSHVCSVVSHHALAIGCQSGYPLLHIHTVLEKRMRRGSGGGESQPRRAKLLLPYESSAVMSSVHVDPQTRQRVAEGQVWKGKP